MILLAIVSARPAIAVGGRKPRMLFCIAEDAAFLSPRLPMARAAEDAGFAVAVICPPRAARAKIEALGYPVHPWGIDRTSMHPGREYLAMDRLRRILETEEPVLLHNVAIKPVLYGAIAANLAGVPFVVNAMNGLGFPFIGRGGWAGCLRLAALAALRTALDRPGSRVLVQNADDGETFVTAGAVTRDRLALIPGSGVDAARFSPTPEPAGIPRATMVTRMEWNKGVGDLAEAARILKDRGAPVVIRLVGDADPADPRTIHPAQLCVWNAAGLVEWKGARRDIPRVWAESAIAVLPSFGEGMPKSLLEAAACGRPLVATDVPGCRDLVADGSAGLMVPPHDPEALADAIERLARDPELRRKMGAAARHMAETRYADAAIERATRDLYRDLSGVGG